MAYATMLYVKNYMQNLYLETNQRIREGQTTRKDSFVRDSGAGQRVGSSAAPFDCYVSDSVNTNGSFILLSLLCIQMGLVGLDRWLRG